MKRFLKIAVVSVIILIPITLFVEESHGHSSLASILSYFTVPGYFLYIIVTGDIHGWKPGPIGEGGRMAVAILGSTFFWTPVIYFLLRLFKK